MTHKSVIEGEMARRPSPSPLVTSPAVLVGLIVVLGFLLRLRGITWGLPSVYDPDEHFFVDPAVRFVITGDMNPHWFGHPGSTLGFYEALFGASDLLYELKPTGHMRGPTVQVLKLRR